jgi:predicted AAA+ superfamily ATPase
MIPADQFYYYKSIAGREIDLIFEVDDTVYAVEIKATKRPGPRDFQNLKQFEDRRKRSVKRILFYPGEEYRTVDDIKLIPIGALHKGK